MNFPAQFKRPSEPRVVFQPRLDKIVETILYLAHRKPRLDHYQAVKLIYLADKDHFNRYGRPITFEIYYAMDYGPVASITLDLIKGTRKFLDEDDVDVFPVRLEKRANIYILAEPLRPINYDLFSKSDLQVLDAIIQEHGSKSFDELYELTHGHFAYESAWNSRPSGIKRSLMFYEDMLDEGPGKASLIEDLEGIS